MLTIGISLDAASHDVMCSLCLLLATYKRVPNRFFGIQDLAYFKAGIRILKETGGDEIRNCDYDRDKGFGDFNKRESGNVALKKPRFGNSRD